MASRIDGIPPKFDVEFLDWFRVRLEDYWVSLPRQTPGEVLTEYVQAGIGGCTWQHGTRWLSGLGEKEIAAVERQWHIAFPPDYRLFLQRLHSVDRPQFCARYLRSPEEAEAQGALATTYVPKHEQYMALQEGPSFYNWLMDTPAIDARFAWLWEGLQFDVEYNDLWLPSWGPKPSILEAQRKQVPELVETAPRLIPIFGHRYLLAEPCAAGNPVLSVWQSDIIVYAANLRDYLLVEFLNVLESYLDDAKALKREAQTRIQKHFANYQAIPFWGEFL